MNGLPYGWWKNADFWAFVLTAIALGVMAYVLLEEWFL